MREILFRAKDEASNKWVYGYYVHLPSAAGSVHIMQVPAGNPDENNTAYYIIPETVGEYTGLTDKNGKKIFEGDIVKVHLSGKQGFGVVEYMKTGICAFVSISKSVFSNYVLNLSNYFTVIGNIHDNPELVEGDADDQP